jgi:competence protein ComEC
MPAPGRTPTTDLRYLALGFLLGILGVYALPRLLPWTVFLLPLSCLLVRWRGRACLASVLAGALLATAQAQQRLDARLPYSEQPQDFWLSGQIAGLPEQQAEGTTSDWRFLFAPVESELGLVRVMWYRSTVEPSAGQCWRFRLRLKSPHGLMNPGGFDYEGWLYREGIGATGYVREAEPCLVGTASALGRAELALLQFRQHLVAWATSHLQAHAMRGFVLGLTVGDASDIDDGQWQVLRRTGTTHLISISGLHITLAASFVFFLVRWLWACWPGLLLRLPAQRAAAALAMLSAIAYALLAGFSVPTQRALVMLLVVMGALLASRQVAPSHLLSLALLAVLLLDPSAVLSPGFWLSFGAVAWMLYVMAARVGPVSRWRSWLVPQGVLSVALVAPCLFWFGESSLVSPLANLVLIPLFGLLIPWLLLAFVLMKTSVGAWMVVAGADCLALIWQGLQWLASVTGAYWTTAVPSLPVLLLAMLGLLLVFAPHGMPARSLGALFCLPLLLPPVVAPPQGHFDLALLDVGQGLSAVVRTQHHSLLFDAGPAFKGGLDSGESVVLPYLRQQGIRKLDRVVLSHGDMDHRGGLAAVRAGIGIGDELGTAAGSACRVGQRWHWDGVEFEILHPHPGDHWSDNDGSCVLQIRAGRYRVLLTGDIQSAAERNLMVKYGERLASDVLVVPHHGSRSSSTEEFVTTVAPHWALVPAGWANRWGFPKPDVVMRYESIQARVESTGTHGALQLRMSPEHGVEQFTRWREQSRRLWRAG